MGNHIYSVKFQRSRGGDGRNSTEIAVNQCYISIIIYIYIICICRIITEQMDLYNDFSSINQLNTDINSDAADGFQHQCRVLMFVFLKKTLQYLRILHMLICKS